MLLLCGRGDTKSWYHGLRGDCSVVVMVHLEPDGHLVRGVKFYWVARLSSG